MSRCNDEALPKGSREVRRCRQRLRQGNETRRLFPPVNRLALSDGCSQLGAVNAIQQVQFERPYFVQPTGQNLIKRLLSVQLLEELKATVRKLGTKLRYL